MKTIFRTTTNKVAVVTGGAKGIGARIAHRFSDNGYSVVITARRSVADGERLVGELREKGGNAICVTADLSLSSDVARLHDATLDTFGRADVIINNAGTSFYGVLASMSDADIKRVLDDDLLSAILVSRAFYDDLAFAGRGCMINISSVWGIKGASTESVYSAAKAGVIALTRSLAKELAPSGIRVNAIAPGAIATDMLSGFSEKELDDIRKEIPLGRLGTPDDVASAALFLASDAASYITGEVLDVSGGYIL